MSPRPGADAGLRAGSGSAPLVATIEKRGKFLVAEPFFGPGPRLAVSRDSRYAAGDLVVVAPGTSGRGGKVTRARVMRRLGRSDVARVVLEALMVDRGLARGFAPDVRQAARQASERPIVPDGRRDLRTLPTITIDPASARDFDDAISCEALPDGGFSVWVHIADVSAYVEPRGSIDREAYRRGTSVYVPGAVEPMLPFELSNGACSLVPGEDRWAVTVEMLVRGSEVVSAAFCRSIIRSDRRFSYEEVDEVFAGGSVDGVAGETLTAARAAAAALGERRANGSALVLDGSEPEFSFDKRGNVTDVTAVAQTESHRLIEHLMIAANEQVARFLDARKLPALYRVHERPEATAIDRMIQQLASLGVPTPPVPRGPLTPQQASEVAGDASALVAAWVAAHDGQGRRALHRIVLRSLKQAYYDPVNRGHSGLSLHSYCHFTSPIRRYPDLICHRALLSAIDGSVPGPEASFVAAAGPACSATERAAMLVERDADDVARCFLLGSEIASGGGLASPEASTFDGEIVGVIGAGAFVAFGDEMAFEGMLPVRAMRGDWYELNDEATALIGERGGALRLGDPIRVRVGGIDAPRGRVNLLPVSDRDENGA